MEANRRLTGDEFFLVNGKILSREASIGCSSRANYYCQIPQGVPFDWERAPGTPKELPRATAPLPPLSPPPAVLSLGLPKPCMEDTDDQKPFSVRSRLKKMIKKCQSKLVIISGAKNFKLRKDEHDSKVVVNVEDGEEESFGFWSPERDEFERSPRRNSSSSSLVSAALSFSGGGSPPAAMDEEPVDDHRHQQLISISCSPLKISGIMDYVTKRLG